MDFVEFSSGIITRKSLSLRHEISWDSFSFKSLLSLSYPFSLSPLLSSLSLSLSLSLPPLSPFSLLPSLSPLSLPLSISHNKN